MFLSLENTHCTTNLSNICDLITNLFSMQYSSNLGAQRPGVYISVYIELFPDVCMYLPLVNNTVSIFLDDFTTNWRLDYVKKTFNEVPVM